MQTVQSEPVGEPGVSPVETNHGLGNVHVKFYKYLVNTKYSKITSCFCVCTKLFAMQPGVLRENAAKAESLITHTLAGEPDNPLALHLHIHLSEASNPLR